MGDEEKKALQTMFADLRKVANALDELADYITPKLECGTRELTEMALNEAFDTLTHWAFVAESIAEDTTN